MTDSNDDEPKTPKLKLVTELAGIDSDDSSKNTVTKIGHINDESKDDNKKEMTIDIFNFAVDEFAKTPPSSITHELLREDILFIMASLSPRERSILELRFGLKDGKTHTLDEVGKLLGVTRERIREIEVKALGKLRHPNRHRRNHFSLSQTSYPSSPLENPSWKEIKSKLGQFRSLDRRILRILWGFVEDEQPKISQIANRFEVSEEYIIDLEKRAKQFLKR